MFTNNLFFSHGFRRIQARVAVGVAASCVSVQVKKLVAGRLQASVHVSGLRYINENQNHMCICHRNSRQAFKLLCIFCMQSDGLPILLANHISSLKLGLLSNIFGIMYKLCKYVNSETLLTVYYSIVYSHLGKCRKVPQKKANCNAK